MSASKAYNKYIKRNCVQFISVKYNKRAMAL